MRSREALRDLQDRLAQRLQAGRADSAQACWLAVHAGGGRYLLPLGQAGEIFPFTPPHPVPYTRPWFLGVVHLRGGLWAAVDLAGFVAAQGAGAVSVTGAGDACGEQGESREGVDGRIAVAHSRPLPASPSADAEARLVTLHPQLDVNGVLRIDRLAGLRGPEDFLATASAPAGAPAWFTGRYTDSRAETWQALSLVALARDDAFLSLSV